MGRFSAFWRLCNAAFPLRDFLYILQLEEYETFPYIRRAMTHYVRRGLEQRDTLKWTQRVKVLACAACAIIFSVLGVAAQYVSFPVFVVIIVIVFIGTPDVVLIANVITKPLFWIAHQRLNARARKVRVSVPQLCVIAIAGSYGKTTTKNLLYDMIRRHHKTQRIEGNINTTAGIAEWMLNRFDPSTEVLIVEMDAYHPGEIAASCKIVQPNMAILTSIGDQHLVRFGSQEKIIQGLQEIFTETVRDGLRVCSIEVAAILKEHGYDHVVKMVATDAIVYQGETIDTAKLSDSVREDAAYAAVIAEAMHVPVRFIDEAIRSFVVPDRRQKEKEVFGYEGIDDSYNISVATAHAGVLAAQSLANASGKKLVVLTAGIPELPRGISEQENAHYGAFLAEHADAVLVLKSEHFTDVVRGIENRIPMMSAANLGEAVPILHAQCPIDEYILLFQPELTDASY